MHIPTENEINRKISIYFGYDSEILPEHTYKLDENGGAELSKMSNGEECYYCTRCYNYIPYVTAIGISMHNIANPNNKSTDYLCKPTVYSYSTNHSHIRTFMVNIVDNNRTLIFDKCLRELMVWGEWPRYGLAVEILSIPMSVVCKAFLKASDLWPSDWEYSKDKDTRK
jgi:hypothetical protein